MKAEDQVASVISGTDPKDVIESLMEQKLAPNIQKLVDKYMGVIAGKDGSKVRVSFDSEYKADEFIKNAKGVKVSEPKRVGEYTYVLIG